MRHCNMNDDLWLNEFKSDDRLVAEHIVACDICRADAVVYQRLRRLISSLPQVSVPVSVQLRFNELRQMTAGMTMNCIQVSDKLSAWYTGGLDLIESFLLENHLLQCPACRGQVAAMDAAGALLHNIKSVTPPSAIRAGMLELSGMVGAGLNCDAVKPLLSLWSDGALSRVESFLIEEHLLSCATCRAQAEKLFAVSGLMHNLPVMETPPTMRESVDMLATAVGDSQITCETALPMIELYRDGMLNSTDSFLLEDHLLWCEPCASVLEQSAIVSGLLSEMPQIDPPAEIAARVRLTKPPLWTKKFITRVAGIAAVAAIALTVSMFSHKSPVNNITRNIRPEFTNNGPVDNNIAPKQKYQPAIRTASIKKNNADVSRNDDNLPVQVKKVQTNTPQKIYNKFRGVIRDSSALIASLAADNNISGTVAASMPVLRELQGLPVRQQVEEQKDRSIAADYMVNEIVASSNVKLAPGQSVRPVRALVTTDRITIRDEMTAIAREDELSAAEDMNAAPDSFMIAMADMGDKAR
jgi:predicted anti-sigma-YlaC factor YlaD